METAAGRFARLPSCKNMIAETTAVLQGGITAPAAMRSARRWILWRPEFKNGKKVKKPVFPYNATQPETWMTFEQALREAEIQNAFLGFVLGNGFIGFDLDGCRDDDGTLNEAAIDLLRLGTYVEESQSKKGLHAIACATIPRSHKDPGFEVYDGAPGHARWFAFTGNRVGDVAEVAYGPELQARVDAYYAKWFAKKPKPEAPETYSDDEVIRLCRSFKNAPKFERLIAGDTSGYKSKSEAVIAFCRLIRFVAREDVAQIDRIVRGSGLMEPKWERTGRATIARALRYKCEYYTPGTGSSFRERQMQGMLWWALRIQGYGEAPIRVLMYLAAHADAEGTCFPKREKIAKDLRIHVDTVDDAIETLMGFKILRKSQRYNKSLMYTLRYSLTPGEPIELPESMKPLRIKARKSQKSITQHILSKPASV
jgi:hypothetical protein